MVHGISKLDLKINIIQVQHQSDVLFEPMPSSSNFKLIVVHSLDYLFTGA